MNSREGWKKEEKTEAGCVGLRSSKKFEFHSKREGEPQGE